MISFLRNSVFLKILWGFMGFYMLNISIDTKDTTPKHLPEDLSINDQESIVEFIVEQILGFENFLKEYDDSDADDYRKKKITTVYLLIPIESNIKDSSNQVEWKKLIFSEYKYHLTNSFKEINTPPPKS